VILCSLSPTSGRLHLLSRQLKLSQTKENIFVRHRNGFAFIARRGGISEEVQVVLNFFLFVCNNQKPCDDFSSLDDSVIVRPIRNRVFLRHWGRCKNVPTTRLDCESM
jgi:hypothetical protein